MLSVQKEGTYDPPSFINTSLTLCFMTAPSIVLAMMPTFSLLENQRKFSRIFVLSLSVSAEISLFRKMVYLRI